MDWEALGIAVSGIAIAINSYWTRKVQHQTKPSNGKKLAYIVEEIRDEQILIRADIVKLKNANTSMAQNLATHLTEDREAFRQLGVERPVHPSQHPGRRIGD